MKVKSKKWYKRECDKLWSKVVRLRAKNKCELCGSINTLNSHHIFGRKAMSTRYDTDNGILLCFKCHFVEAHQNPARFYIWLVEKRGREWYDKLNKRHNNLIKMNYEVMYIWLKAQLSEVENAENVSTTLPIPIKII